MDDIKIFLDNLIWYTENGDIKWTSKQNGYVQVNYGIYDNTIIIFERIDYYTFKFFIGDREFEISNYNYQKKINELIDTIKNKQSHIYYKFIGID